MSRRTTTLALWIAGASLAAAAAPPAAPRPGVWFCGDFEAGDLRGWILDARRDRAVVVSRPVRRGRHAVRVTLAPGDVAASKERAELKLSNREIERERGGEGGEMWYGWSLLIPADYAEPPAGRFQILGQWHHRPAPAAHPRGRAHVKGPPPLTLHLLARGGKDVLILFGRAAPRAPRRALGERAVRRGAWIDLVFHIRWSTGGDGFVAAWLDGRPFTTGKRRGPTLYTPVSNYLRLGLYRAAGVPTTNHVYFDEVRLGESYQAVAP